MPPRIAVLAVFAVLIACACKAKHEPAPRGAAASSAAAPAAATSAPVARGSAEPLSAPVLADGDVASFVSRWEAAQNDRNFEQYARMYAERFMGVKRVGSYSKRFDRAGWLADRKPMFDGSAKVHVSQLELARAPGVARVIFTQEFVSSGFRDVGRKELFLVPTPGGIVISREEMLSSRVSSAEQLADGVMAYHRDGAVLARGFAKRKLTGAPRLISDPTAETIDVAFDLSKDAMSDEIRSWLGRSVTVYSARGESCTAPIARFEVRLKSEPHFGMRNVWNGLTDEPKAPPAQIAATVHGMAQDDELFVVGVLAQPCDGTWASARPLPFTLARPVTGELATAALAAFKGLPAYAKLQRSFVAQGGDAARGWETVDGEVKLLELRAPGRPALVVISARAGAACGGFSGSLSALWQLGSTEAAPRLTPVTTFDDYVTVSGALDRGGAAGLSLLGGPDNYNDEVVTLSPFAKGARSVLFATAYWDCGC